MPQRFKPSKLSFVSIIAAATMAAGLVAAPANASPPIESAYSVHGPYSTTVTSVATTSGEFLVFHPSQFQALGFASPIVTWGNGSGATPETYSAFLNHLASWGFSVIASTQTQAGSGAEVLAGAQYMVAQNAKPGSIFYHHLDPGAVAAAGHSQGAGGATRAAIANPGLIKTLVTFSLPWNGQDENGPLGAPPNGTGFVSANSSCPTALDCWYNPAQVTQPVFFVGTHGLLDWVIANPDVQRYYFEEAAGRAALGLIQLEDDHGDSNPFNDTYADHNSIQTNPARFLGYVTAWLMNTLRHNTAASSAFSGVNPEITTNANWPGSATRG
jgi:pimeloyl-ACP methyl ester carboxylesterase